MSRHVLLPAVLVVAVLVATSAGCGQSTASEVTAPEVAVPEVTFSVADRTTRVGPIRYCDVELTQCEADDSAVATLDVPTDQPVQISVPEAVAETPWQVVFRYRKGAEEVGGRSEVFAPGARQDYTLRAPEGGTFETIEVQQYGAPELVDGEPNFRIRAAWVLAFDSSATPEQP